MIVSLSSKAPLRDNLLLLQRVFLLKCAASLASLANAGELQDIIARRDRAATSNRLRARSTPGDHKMQDVRRIHRELEN
jgi:hypothetical protein